MKGTHLNHPRFMVRWDAIKKRRNLDFPSRVSNKTAPVRRWAIWGRLSGARAARDIQPQPITFISPPMFNFAHIDLFHCRRGTEHERGRPGQAVMVPADRCQRVWRHVRSRKRGGISVCNYRPLTGGRAVSVPVPSTHFPWNVSHDSTSG